MSEFLARLAGLASVGSDLGGSAIGGSGRGGSAPATAHPRLPERFAPPDVDTPTPGDTSPPVSEASLPVADASPPVAGTARSPAEESQKVGEESLKPAERSQTIGEESLAVSRTGFETLAPQPTAASHALEPNGSSLGGAPTTPEATRHDFETLASLAPQSLGSLLAPQPTLATLAPQVQPLPSRQSAPSAPDVLHVTIGRIDVRIPAAPPAAAPRSPAHESADQAPLSLADYLDGKRSS